MQKIAQIKPTKLKEKYRSKDSEFIRKRKLSFEDCIAILLNKKSRSVQTAIDEYFEQKGKENASAQSFAKARENINPQAILDINKSIIEEFEKQNTDKKLYKKHRIFSIDGSYISLPNSRFATEKFRFSTNQNGIKRAKGLAMTMEYLKEQNYKNIITALGQAHQSFVTAVLSSRTPIK